MKAKWMLTLLGVLVLASPVRGEAPAGKTGWVDTERVFKEYHRARELLGDDSPLVRQKQEKEAELEQLQDELAARQKDLEQKALLLNEAALRTQQEEILRRQIQLRRLIQEAEVELQGKIMAVTKELSREIAEKIEEFARREGYSYIFRGEALFYHDPSLELTDQVLAELNRGHEAVPASGE